MSAVSAQENTTDIVDIPLNEIEKNLDDTNTLIEESEPNSTSINENQLMSENEKQDINATIIFPDEISTDELSPLEYYIEIDNLPDDYDTNMTIFIDDTFLTTTNVRNPVKIQHGDYSNGEHNINVELPETEKYVAKNITKMFIATNILIEIPENIVVGEMTTSTYMVPLPEHLLLITTGNNTLKKAFTQLLMGNLTVV